MILCTNYGLLVYDFTIDQPKPDSNEESKDSTQKLFDLSAKYRISVLPEEAVIDCVVLDPKRPRESQLLVCCASGSYVILRRSQNTFQESWRFKGFSLPPKGLLVCDENRVLVVEARSLALIDVRKKEIAQFITKIPSNPPLAKSNSVV
jgi:hypothetical protein